MRSPAKLAELPRHNLDSFMRECIKPGTQRAFLHEVFFDVLLYENPKKAIGILAHHDHVKSLRSASQPADVPGVDGEMVCYAYTPPRGGLMGYWQFPENLIDAISWTLGSWIRWLQIVQSLAGFQAMVLHPQVWVLWIHLVVGCQLEHHAPSPVLRQPRHSMPRFRSKMLRSLQHPYPELFLG